MMLLKSSKIFWAFLSKKKTHLFHFCVEFLIMYDLVKILSSNKRVFINVSEVILSPGDTEFNKIY